MAEDPEVTSQVARTIVKTYIATIESGIIIICIKNSY